LAPDQPTIAREASPGQAASGQEEPVSRARFKHKRNAPSALDPVRVQHSGLLGRLIAEIRRRKYSIRTEQAYESWVWIDASLMPLEWLRGLARIVDFDFDPDFDFDVCGGGWIIQNGALV
jgi:hypothetical protein